MMETTAVCLPTYNEAENIRSMVEAVLQNVPEALVLIIDDASPDGTGEIAESLSAENRQIRVLHRHAKEGLGKAYLDGFRFALDRLRADFVIQMDADLSHPPERLPRMISAAHRADLVIGSRYVKGGSTKNWGLFRKAVSRFGSLYARSILGVAVNDLTGGFKVWHRELLGRVLRFPISSGGYVFQVETTYVARKLGASIVEVPIVFTDRGLGTSKMSMSIALEAFWRIPFIRFFGERSAEDAM